MTGELLLKSFCIIYASLLRASPLLPSTSIRSLDLFAICESPTVSDGFLLFVWLLYIVRCEAFSTYPRTYDLLHAWNVFSKVDERGCSIEDLMLEMDRIVRPLGLIIIRDKASMVDQIGKYLTALRWDKWSKDDFTVTVDSLTYGEEKILMARKRQWQLEADDEFAEER